VSATEKKGRRHTSFVEAVEVISIDKTIPFDWADVKVEKYRGSGAGGQHRNKTETCIRLTHCPTGIVASGTESRSQHQNLKVAEALLRSRLECGRVDTDVPVDQQWNWCEWRNEVTLPNGKKKNMTQVLKKGI
jgi:protein subunit release factor A